jgi:DNA-binding XRE family transcriptional regulator
MSKDIDAATSNGVASSPAPPPRVDRRTREQLDALPPEARTRAEAAIALGRDPEHRIRREEVAEAAGAAGSERSATAGPPTWGRHGDLLDFLAFLGSLRGERERLGLSLDDMSERTGMDRMAISRLENGKNPNPTISTLVRYVNGLGRSLAWGLEGTTSAERR